VDVVGVGVGGGFLLVLMIEAPHPLHTHRRSTYYIYEVFQHLLQWLVVISILLQPDICLVVGLSIRGGFLLVLMIETPRFPSYS
jgi:hypothetical protein